MQLYPEDPAFDSYPFMRFCSCTLSRLFHNVELEGSEIELLLLVSGTEANAKREWLKVTYPKHGG